MNNPNARTVQEWIAKRLGYTWLILRECTNQRHTTSGHWHDLHGDECFSLPNWALSLDTARGLEVKCGVDFAQALSWEMGQGDLEEQTNVYGVSVLLKYTALQWCLAYIRSEHGYRWVECNSLVCTKGRAIFPRPSGELNVECLKCSGQGGKFEKVCNDE